MSHHEAVDHEFAETRRTLLVLICFLFAGTLLGPLGHSETKDAGEMLSSTLGGVSLLMLGSGLALNNLWSRLSRWKLQ